MTTADWLAYKIQYTCYYVKLSLSFTRFCSNNFTNCTFKEVLSWKIEEVWTASFRRGIRAQLNPDLHQVWLHYIPALMQSLQCIKVPADATQGISGQSQTRVKNTCQAYFRGMPNLALSLYIKHGFSHCDIVPWFCILKRFVECKRTDTCWLNIINTVTGGNRLQVSVPMKAATALTLSFPSIQTFERIKKLKVTPYSSYEGGNYPITPGCKHAF